MPTAYILQPRAHVRLRSERIEVWAPPEEGGSPQRVRDVPLFDLERIVLREGSQITSEALCALLRSEIPVGWIGWNDRFLGGFHPAANAHGAARLRQYQRTLEGDFALQIARQLVGAKIHNQKRLLQRLAANRSIPAPGAAHLNALQDRVARAANREALLGLEGAAAACYFEGWASFLPPEFPFERRSTRPPHNPVNACLSFGATRCRKALVTSQDRRNIFPSFRTGEEPSLPKGIGDPRGNRVPPRLGTRAKSPRCRKALVTRANMSGVKEIGSTRAKSPRCRKALVTFCPEAALIAPQPGRRALVAERHW
jgi:hypothetical protein